MQQPLSKYTIRLSAHPDDGLVQGAARGEVARMDAVCLPHDTAPNLEGAYWWLAKTLEGDLVGYAGLKPVMQNCGYLCRAGVLPSQRGNGLQKRLIRVRVQHARRLGMCQVLTDTAAHNHPSSNSLIREGFKLYSPEYKWAGEGDDVLYWYKSL